jgi:hypothetical protein
VQSSEENYWAGGVVVGYYTEVLPSVVGYLLSMHKALGFILSIAKQKQKQKENKTEKPTEFMACSRSWNDF